MIKAIILFTTLAMLSGGISWIARGKYDHYFMMEGAFHVINHGKGTHEVLLRFPSGKTKKFNLGAGATTHFRLKETGEGSIEVTLDGKARDEVGYVTSMNGIVVLVIGEKTTNFSQIFPAIMHYPLAQTTNN